MDLNDAERYAVAALFTLALHVTHVSLVAATWPSLVSIQHACLYHVFA